MQIELTTRDGQGEVLLLPNTFAIDEYDTGKNIPGTTLPGRDGRFVYKHLQRIEPVQMRLSGSMFCEDRETADQVAGDLRSKLMGQRQLVQLKRYEGADRFIRVDFTQIAHNPHRGRFNAGLFTFTMGAQADDPFWYAVENTRIEKNVVFTSPVTIIEIDNDGGYFVEPILYINGKTSGSNHTKNFKLTNYTNGDVLEYKGTVKNQEHVVFLTEKQSAVFYGAGAEWDLDPYYVYEAQAYGGTSGMNVVKNVNHEYLLNGFRLEAGKNLIEVEEPNGLLSFSLVFRRRWL